LVSGKPYIYSDTDPLGPPPNESKLFEYNNLTFVFVVTYFLTCNNCIIILFIGCFYGMCETAQMLSKKEKPRGIAKVRGMSVRLRDKSTEEGFFAKSMKDIGILALCIILFVKNFISIFLILYFLAQLSNSAPATCASSPTDKKMRFINYPYNLPYSIPSQILDNVIGATHKVDLAKVYLPDDLKNDNINNEESENIDQSKSNETASK